MLTVFPPTEAGEDGRIFLFLLVFSFLDFIGLISAQTACNNFKDKGNMKGALTLCQPNRAQGLVCLTSVSVQNHLNRVRARLKEVYQSAVWFGFGGVRL